MAVSFWLSFSTAVQGNISYHRFQFAGLGGFTKI